MRTSFANKKSSGFSFEEDRIIAERASSPDQLAVVWNESGQIIVASPVRSVSASAYEIDLRRMPADFKLAALKTQRENHPDQPALSAETHF